MPKEPKKIREGAPPPPEYRPQIRWIIVSKDVTPKFTPDYASTDGGVTSYVGEHKVSLTIDEDLIPLGMGQRLDGQWYVTYMKAQVAG